MPITATEKNSGTSNTTSGACSAAANSSNSDATAASVNPPLNTRRSPNAH